MRSLTAPVVDDAAALHQAAAFRHLATRATLHAVVPTVVAAYGTYATTLPETVPTPLSITEAERVALRTNYRLLEPGASMSWLRADVLSAATHYRCPYCDSAQATTVDHYLPKGQYPEYAILSANLVPSCPRCNTARVEALHGPHGHIWHAYLDPVPAVPILFATLVPAPHAIGAAFHLANPHGASATQFAKLQLLFDELELADFFRREAANQLSGLSPAFSSRWLHEGNDGARAQAATERVREVAHYGMNSWPAALATALAAVNDFGGPEFDRLVRGPVIL